MQDVTNQLSFGGRQRVLEHVSSVLGCSMRFAVYEPPAAQGAACPVVLFLSGLTCTEQNVITKGGAQRACAELGLTFVCPDTSPRGAHVPDDVSDDLGQGAGFYLDAEVDPWAKHYKMESYLMRELLPLLAELPSCGSKVSIMGHSMGGHGALTLGLRHAQRFESISALAPICAPTRCPWGRKAFAAYLGASEPRWAEHDACELIRRGVGAELPLLIDHGSADPFLETELKPELLSAACKDAGREGTLRLQVGYDHSYYFIASFMAEHLAFHARHLAG